MWKISLHRKINFFAFFCCLVYSVCGSDNRYAAKSQQGDGSGIGDNGSGQNIDQTAAEASVLAAKKYLSSQFTIAELNAGFVSNKKPVTSNTQEGELSLVEGFTTNENYGFEEQGDAAAQLKSTTPEEESSSSWLKTLGIGLAATAGVVAVGAGVAYGVNEYLESKGSNLGNEISDLWNKVTGKSNTQTSDPVALPIVENSSDVMTKELADAIKDATLVIDTHTGSMSIDSLPEGKDELSTTDKNGNLLKDTLISVVELTPPTVIGVAGIISAVGGKDNTGEVHSAVLKRNVYSDLENLGVIEEDLKHANKNNLASLQGVHKELGGKIKDKIVTYIKSNDSRYNGNKNSRRDAYFDKKGYIKHIGEFVKGHRNYFPEYNINRANKSGLKQLNFKNAINTLEKVVPKTNEEKQNVTYMKDILEVLSTGKPLEDKEKAKLEYLLSGNRIKELEEKSGVVLADYVSAAKSITDSEKRYLEKTPEEKELFDKSIVNEHELKVPSKIVVKKAQIAQDENNNVRKPAFLGTDEQLKKMVSDSVMNNKPLPLEILNEVNSRKLFKENKSIENYIKSEIEASLLVEGYRKHKVEGKPIDRGMIGKVSSNPYAVRRIANDYKGLTMTLHEDKSKLDVIDVLYHSDITRGHLMEMYNNTRARTIIANDPEILVEFNKKVQAYRELDCINSRVNVEGKITLDEYRAIIKNPEHKRILKNAYEYPKLYKAVVQKETMVNMIDRFSKVLENGGTIREADMHTLYANKEAVGLIKEVAPYRVQKMFENKYVQIHYNNNETHKMINKAATHSKFIESDHAISYGENKIKGNIKELLLAGSSHEYLQSVHEQNRTQTTHTEEGKYIREEGNIHVNIGSDYNESYPQFEKNDVIDEKLENNVRLYHAENYPEEHYVGALDNATAEDRKRMIEDISKEMYSHEGLASHHVSTLRMSGVRSRSEQKQIHSATKNH